MTSFNPINSLSKAVIPYDSSLSKISIKSQLEKVVDEVFRSSWNTQIADCQNFSRSWRQVSPPSPHENDPHFLTPPLTGKYQVGIKSYYADKEKRLLIDVHYPGIPKHARLYKVHPLCAHRHPMDIERIEDQSVKEKMSNLWTRSQLELTPFPDEKFPIILFSHGAGCAHHDYQSIIEELASQGYCVIATSHPSSNQSSYFGIADPDIDPEPTPGQYMFAIAEGTKDVRFVLEQIRNHRIAGFEEFLSSSLDADSIGVLGHSLGGGIALQACKEIDLIHAGIDLDGAVLRNQDKAIVIQQPFLTIAAGKGGGWREGSEDYEDWERYHALSPNSKKITLENAEHGDFSLDRLFKAKKTDELDREALELNTITNRLIKIHFNKHLKKL
jgi:dienelactone hydrolase